MGTSSFCFGESDAQAAVAAARREGFAKQTIIFLDQEQGGLLSIFDSWFSRALTKLSSLDREQPWEDSVKAHAAGMSGPAQDLAWDLSRLRLFLDRWEQGRVVPDSAVRSYLKVIQRNPRAVSEALTQ